MSYADQKNIPFVMLVGSEEMESGKLKLRDMQTGEQDELYIDDIIAQLRSLK